MSAYVGPNKPAERVIKSVGAIVASGRYFRVMKEHLEISLPYGGEVRAPVLIVTHHLRETISRSAVTFRFIADGFESAVRQAKAAAGDKNVMLFGATMAQLGMETGLADEIQLHLVPLLLGGSIRLIDQTDAGPVKLERIGVVESPKVIDLRFRIVK